MEKNEILIILLVISITILLVIAAIFVFLPLFVFYTASTTQPVDVNITDLSYSEAEFDDGLIVSINVSFINKGIGNETVSMPIIITDTGRELNCYFISVDENIDASYGKIILPHNIVVNATVITRDNNYSCECLVEGEKPISFEYQLGSGVIAPPSIKRKDIPEVLINI